MWKGRILSHHSNYKSPTNPQRGVNLVKSAEVKVMEVHHQSFHDRIAGQKPFEVTLLLTSRNFPWKMLNADDIPKKDIYHKWGRMCALGMRVMKWRTATYREWSHSERESEGKNFKIIYKQRIENSDENTVLKIILEDIQKILNKKKVWRISVQGKRKPIWWRES